MRKHLLICIFLLLSVSGFSQCISAVAISSSYPSICSGNSVQLTASVTGGTSPYTYVWSTGEVTSSINVNKAGTYTVTVSNASAGCPPVKQSITIGASPTPMAPTIAPFSSVCPGSTATITASAPGGDYTWYDYKNNVKQNGGATFQTDPIVSSTTYFVETTVNGCTSARTSFTVNPIGDPHVTGQTVCSGSSATLYASGNSFTWYDGAGNVVSTANSYTTPPLTATTVYYVIVVINGCTSKRIPVTATVAPPPPIPAVNANQSVCSGGSVTLHADSPTGMINWYSVASGGVPLISSPDFTTPSLTQTTSYWAETVSNSCESQRAMVTVTVNPVPVAPNPQTLTVCYGTSATLTAGPPGSRYRWFDQAGNLLSDSVVFITPVLTQTATYNIQAYTSSCSSAVTTVTVNVNPQPPAPTVNSALVCYGGTAVLQAASNNGGTFNWFSSKTANTPFFSGATYTTPALDSTITYYVQNIVSGCKSALAAVTVTVLPRVAAPTVAAQTVCSGNSATLTANGTAAGYAWYATPAASTPIATSQVYVTPPLTSSTTYYLEATSGGCTSTRVPVMVTVNPVPAQPAITGPAQICPGTTATLTASVPSGTVYWYNTATGGTQVASGTTFTTHALNTDSTYYAENQNGDCTSARAAFTVKVINIVSPQFQYPSGTYCPSVSTATPVINNTAGGTFSASPAGLVFNNVTTGQINIAASSPGRYLVTFTNNAPCPTNTTAIIFIATNPDASFSYTTPVCKDDTNPKPHFPAGSGPGVFSATPSGLVFANNMTGEINLKASKPGSYQVTNTISAAASCASAVSAVSGIVIQPQVIVNAGPNQTVAAGSQVQLAGNISGPVTSGTWLGGTGSFSNPSSVTAVYTPGAGETSAVLTLTSADPPGACGPHKASVTITFSPKVAAPTVPPDTICAGSSATLSAIAPGGVYKWFASIADTVSLYTGTVFTTPVLTGNSSYYVQTTLNGVTSARSIANVIVNNTPATPGVSPASACYGSSATLTAGGSSGIYKWYATAAGGSPLAEGSTFVTPVLTDTVSYFVEAVNAACTSSRVKTTVSIHPVPVITSAVSGAVCSGAAQNYNITANQAGTVFLWSRAVAAGISNQAVNNISSSAITETLINTTGGPVNVVYVITAIAGGCSSQPFNYTVTVNPTPVVTGPQRDTICDYTSADYAITFNTPGTAFTWARAAVAGISNMAVTGQQANVIREILFNQTNAPVNVTYAITYTTATCAGGVFNLIVTVNPEATITSSSQGIACTGVPQAYQILSNIPNATFNWSRDAVPNISNPAVNNQTSSVISEALINTSHGTIQVNYLITPIVNGCPGTSFVYHVNVNPGLPAVVANANSPVCVGSAINLSTKPITGATYLWTGPNGFSSAEQNPVVSNVSAANGGMYSLIVTINGCNTALATVMAVVDAPPLAMAGPDVEHFCVTNTQLPLNGSITGGTSTGIWSTSGSGTFYPSSDFTAAKYYVPSAADKAAGSIVITLSSTSKDNCNISSSSFTLNFGAAPGVNAGPDQGVCSETSAVTLNGNVLIAGGGTWSTLGSGSFSPSAAQINGTPNTYVPSSDDIKNGFVNLVLTANAASSCNLSTDTVRISFIAPPTVSAGGNRYVLQGNQITLMPKVSDNNVTYLWSPNIDINDVTAKEPVITGDVDRYYTLTVTDSRGCTSSDSAFIKVSPKLIIDNAFTPNGDGINDYWVIKGISAYTQATIDIFNRYGQKLFHSIGYGVPWDGTYNRQPLPFGTYYYIIDTKYQGMVLSGYVTIIR